VAFKALDDFLKGGVRRENAILAATDIVGVIANKEVPTNHRRWLLDEDYLRDSWERHFGDDWEPDGWQRLRWVGVQLDPITEGDRDPSEWQALFAPYLFDPPPSALAEANPDQWLVPLDDTYAAYPIGRAVREVAERMDGYLADHHVDPQSLPYWMVGD
jgi:hypothetical protein